MAKTKTASPLKPTKGVRPDFGGVPGALVPLTGIALEFGRQNRSSPYDSLLDELARATDEAIEKKEPKPGLKFDDLRAKPSIYARAKKKGLRVVFAVAGAALYVRMEGRNDDHIKDSRRAAILKMLAGGAVMTYMQITNKLRADGDLTIDGPIVDAIMLQLMRTGSVVRQEGGAWKSAPLRKAS